MVVRICPRCNQRYTVESNTIDFIHICKTSNPTLDQEDVVVTGDWTDYTSPTIISPISHWKMNDNASNTVVTDSAGNSNGTASSNTNTMSTPGKINQALDFDGSENINLVAGDTLIPDTNSWSIGLWFNADVIDGKRKLIEFRSDNGGANPGFDLHVNTTNLLRTGYYQTVGGVSQETIKTISTGNWFHVIATYDGTNLKCYVNGILELTTEIGLDIISSDVARVGDGFVGGGSAFFDGKIDDVRIYNNVLTQPGVDTIYNSSFGTEEITPIIITKVGNIMMQGAENNLFGTRGWIEGEDVENRTARGKRASTRRQRQHLSFIKLKGGD